MKHRPTTQLRPQPTPQPTSQPTSPSTSTASPDRSLFTARGRYTRLLPLSHMVPTFYPSAPGQAQPRSGAPQIQLADADLQARAQRLVNVLYWAAEACAGTPGMDDPQTLKVFITPEFYFRRASPDEVADREFRRNTSFGSYPETDRAALVQALHAAVGDAALFQDWLIVAGTICSVLPRAPGQRMNLLNSALLLRGPRSEPDGSPPFVVMEKHYISNIDGPPPALHANLDPTTVFSFHLNPDQVLDNLVHWDGLTLGVEVCLDHAKQVLVNAMNNLHFTIGPDVPPPDLQLVTSCGMDLVDQAVAVRDGGLVFLTDGMSHAGDGLPEPQFQFARFLADGPFIEEFGPDTFNFHELPETEDYQVRYFHGRYQALGRRQGVWCGQQPLALNEPAAAPTAAPTATPTATPTAAPRTPEIVRA